MSSFFQCFRSCIFVALSLVGYAAFAYVGFDENGIFWYYRQSSEGYAILDGRDELPGQVTAIDADDVTASLEIPSELVGDTGGVIVIGIGPKALYNLSGVVEVIIPEGITNIEESAFSGCENLKSINFPSTLKSIGPSAFSACSSLGNVSFNDGLENIGNDAFQSCTRLNVLSAIPAKSIGGSAFNNCSSLSAAVLTAENVDVGSKAFFSCSAMTSAVFSQSVNRVGENAFSGCVKLNSLEFCEGVVAIGGVAFSSHSDPPVPACVELEKVTFGGEVGEIGVGAFAGCKKLSGLDFPSRVGGIGGSAFSPCEAMTNVVFASKVGPIGGSAFASNVSLTNVAFSSEVGDIGDSAFSGSGLRSVYFPGCVGAIGASTFASCSSLKTAVFDGAVKSVGNKAFASCSSLMEVRFADKVGPIGDEAFSGDKKLADVQFLSTAGTIGTSCFSSCSGLTNVVFELSVDAIGDTAFFKCTALETVYFGGDLGTIGDYAFSRCLKLKEMDLPNSVTNMGISTFHFCSALGRINIPTSLTVVPNAMCMSCASLTNVVFHDAIRQIDAGAFSACSSLVDLTLPPALEAIGEGILMNSGFWNLPTTTGPIVIKDDYVIGRKDPIPEVINMTDEMFAKVKLFADGVFSRSSVIREVIFRDSMPLSVGMFEDSIGLERVVLPSDALEIPDRCFRGCVKLTTITVPENLQTIGVEAFGGCCALADFSFPETLIAIKSGAFRDCASLSAVILPSGIQSLALDAFSGCDSVRDVLVPLNCPVAELFPDCAGALTTIMVSSPITEIVPNCFVGCSNLQNVVLADSVTTIGTNAFAGCSVLTNVEMTASVTSIGDDAFDGCLSLMSATMPMVRPLREVFPDTYWKSGFALTIADGSTAICDQAFANCHNINKFSLPNTIQTIGAFAFSNCYNMASITIPEWVTSIGDKAFYGCDKLEKVYYLGPTPKASSSIYEGIDNQTLVSYVYYPYLDGFKKSYLMQTWWWPNEKQGYPVEGLSADEMPNKLSQITFCCVPDGSFAGGVVSTGIYYVAGHPYRNLPTPERKETIEGEEVSFKFLGWWTDPDDGERIKEGESIVPESDIKLYSHWAPPYAARIGDEKLGLSYMTLQEALDAVKTSPTNLITIVRNLAPLSGTYSVTSNCRVDFGGKAIWTKEPNLVFEVKPGVDVGFYNGMLKCADASPVAVDFKGDSTSVISNFCIVCEVDASRPLIKLASSVNLELNSCQLTNVFANGTNDVRYDPVVQLDGPDEQLAIKGAKSDICGTVDRASGVPTSAITITAGRYAFDPSEYLNVRYQAICYEYDEIEYASGRVYWEVLPTGWGEHVKDGGDLKKAVALLDLADENAKRVLQGEALSLMDHVALYNSFVDWVLDSTNEVAESVAMGYFANSPHILLAYVCDDRGLLGRQLSPDSIVFEDGVYGSTSDGFVLTFGIDGVSIGKGVRASMLREVIEIVGAGALTDRFTSDSVQLTELQIDGESFKAVVSPIGEPSSFFYRVNIK